MQDKQRPPFSKQSAIRQHYLQLRRNISTSQQRRASQSVCEQILSSPDYKRSHHIAAYVSVGNEIDLDAFIQQAVLDKKKVYLPRIVETNIELTLYTGKADLVANRFGILEPPKDGASICAEQIDLIYLPLVAFDKHGHRVGMGGGYYDRYLCRVKNDLTPTRIGVAHALQEVDDCLANEWDVALHKVIQAAW